MNLVQRVKDILLKPNETWPAIEAEEGDVASIFKTYLIILAAIPAIAHFIGMSIIGSGFSLFGYGYSYREPILYGLVQMVLSYGLSLVMIYVMSLIINALAPTFKGSKHPLNALKVIAYSATAGYVGGIFQLIPMMGVLGVLAGCYGIYLLYTGLPALMKCPPDQSVGYTVVIILCAIGAALVLYIPVGIMNFAFTATGLRGSGADISFKTPQGDVSVNGSKLTDMANKLEAASKKMEQAQKSDDPNAAGKAAADMMGALTGAKGGAPLAPADLKAILPEAIGGMKRNSIEATGTAVMGMSASSAKADYNDGDKRINLSITDTGGFAGLMAVAGWASLTVDKETNDTIEKVYKSGKRTVREEYRKDNSSGEYMVILENGVLVQAQGNNIDYATIKSAVESLDLSKLEAMQRAEKAQ